MTPFEKLAVEAGFTPMGVVSTLAAPLAKFRDLVLADYQAKLLAGVEMPEPDKWLSGDGHWVLDEHKSSRPDKSLYREASFTEDQLQQYGDARDQAGYFRGVANINEELRSSGVYPKWHVDALTEVAEQRGYLRGLEDAEHAVRQRWPNTRYAEAIEKLKGVV